MNKKLVKNCTKEELYKYIGYKWDCNIVSSHIKRVEGNDIIYFNMDIGDSKDLTIAGLWLDDEIDLDNNEKEFVKEKDMDDFENNSSINDTHKTNDNECLYDKITIKKSKFLDDDCGAEPPIEWYRNEVRELNARINKDEMLIDILLEEIARLRKNNYR